uniref:Uncharacterized protein n=1 Tax=Romanomermis culicivorax TaxID=13658 RepID=A0A915JG80_ROMCU
MQKAQRIQRKNCQKKLKRSPPAIAIQLSCCCHRHPIIMVCHPVVFTLSSHHCGCCRRCSVVVGSSSHCHPAIAVISFSSHRHPGILLLLLPSSHHPPVITPSLALLSHRRRGPRHHFYK